MKHFVFFLDMPHVDSAEHSNFYRISFHLC